MSYLPDRSSPKRIYTSWQERFRVDTKEEVNEFCKKNGYTTEWNDDGSILYYKKVNAAIKYPETKEDLWFNQIHSHHGSYFLTNPIFMKTPLPALKFYPFHSAYGDGDEIEEEVMQKIRKINWDCSKGIRYEPGDVLVLENRLVQHGRIGFKGDQRKLLVGLTQN